MSERVNLKELEKKAYKSTFIDGLWDIFMGMIILSLGTSTSLGTFLHLPELWDTILFSLVWNIAAFLIFYLGKKFITVPRIGFVKFGIKCKSKLLKLKIFLSIVVIINVILFIFPFIGISKYFQLEPFLIILLLGFGVFTIPLCIVAYFLDFTRLYYYAFSIGIGLFLTELLDPLVGAPLNAVIIFGSIGGIILAIGLFYFIHFLKAYPLPKEEEGDG